jgi:hypothetical protein
MLFYFSFLSSPRNPASVLETDLFDILQDFGKYCSKLVLVISSTWCWHLLGHLFVVESGAATSFMTIVKTC